jgi:hypothetical protein
MMKKKQTNNMAVGITIGTAIGAAIGNGRENTGIGIPI